MWLYFIYNVFHAQKVASHCKEQNKKRILTIGHKTKKLFKVKKCQKNTQKTQIKTNINNYLME